MLVEKQMSKVKQGVMVVLIIVTNAIVGYVLYANFTPKRRPKVVIEQTEAPAPQAQKNVSALEVLPEQIDTSLLDNPNFKALKKFGSWPVPVPATGRPNPFIPVTPPPQL